MNYPWFLFVALMGPFLAAAQGPPQPTYGISGRVVSALTKAYIPYCQVTYEANKGTTSDSLGYFTIENLPAGRYTLAFRAIGYPGADTTIFLSSDRRGSNWPVKTTCAELNRASALTDIGNNQMKLFLQSGDPPLRYKSQRRFSKKYGIRFYDVGDRVPYGYDCMVAYNRTIFAYLDQRYGKTWRTAIRPDVPGYE